MVVNLKLKNKRKRKRKERDTYIFRCAKSVRFSRKKITVLNSIKKSGSRPRETHSKFSKKRIYKSIDFYWRE